MLSKKKDKRKLGCEEGEEENRHHQFRVLPGKSRRKPGAEITSTELHTEPNSGLFETNARTQKPALYRLEHRQRANGGGKHFHPYTNHLPASESSGEKTTQT